MSILEIREAKREGARLVVGIAGVSGSGKTYSALKLGYGLANRDSRKLGFLDCENKRGSLYADLFKPSFLIGDLYAPFSPQRYIEAISEFQSAGVEVLVIDSVTHEWEGPGGADEIANGGNSKMPNWKLAKREHKRFVNALLMCDMHVITCIRAREKTSFTDPRSPVNLGIQPIQEKNFMFEMTASMMMHDSGKSQEVLKCPAELVHILGRGNDYITDLDGMALRQWVDGGSSDPVEPFRNKMRFAAISGSESLKAAWGKLSNKEKALLTGEFMDTVKAQAAAVDAGEPTDEPPIDLGGAQ